MLTARDIAKSYGGVRALRGADLTIRPGSVHALLGENGAGKSTLIKILTGVTTADSGTIEMHGQPVRFASTRAAVASGVAVVSQELTVFGDLDVLANLHPYVQPKRLGLIDRAAMTRASVGVMAELGLHLDPRTPLGDLSLAEQQMVEISRALLQKPRLLILDEPTSALDAEEAGRLLEVLDRLRRSGASVLLVSHMLDEVRQVADEVTILRDGVTAVNAEPMANLTIPAIVSAMLGPAKEVIDTGTEVTSVKIAPLAHDLRGPLTVDHISVPGALRDVSLTVEPGTVMGLAGVAGAGHSTLLGVLSGHVRSDAGMVTLPSGETLGRGNRAAIRQGVAMVTGDRRRLGLNLEDPVWANMAQVSKVALAPVWSWVDPASLRRRADTLIDQLSIMPATCKDRPAGTLSGGNQQKVVLAKWLEITPRVLLLDDPTRGVDVGAKAEAHAIIRTLAASGRVVLFCTTDVEELAELSDRVAVFRHGAVQAELSGTQLTPDQLLVAMNGDTTAPNAHKESEQA